MMPQELLQIGINGDWVLITRLFKTSKLKIIKVVENENYIY